MSEKRVSDRERYTDWRRKYSARRSITGQRVLLVV